MRQIPQVPRLIGIALLVGGALALPGVVASGADAEADITRASAVARDVNGAFVARVQLSTTSSGKVQVSVRAEKLTTGFHGFHVHAVGQCVPPFTTAGGHYDTAGHPHGQHAGDLPVLLTHTDGSSVSSAETDRFRVADLFDADRSAIIIHAAADNYANIPARYTSSTTGLPGPDEATLTTGDSGGRVACGVIVRS